jgi:hypothetical protein
MHRRRPALADDCRVGRRDVADVLREPVRRIERVQPPHQPIARDLRDDRRGRDRSALRVAVDDREVRGSGLSEAEAVDETRLGRGRERAEHGPKAGEVRAV